MASLEADLTSTGVNEVYITHDKSKVNSTIQDAEGNNVLLPQGPTNNDKEEVLAGSAATLSLLSPTNNLNSQNLNQSHMKCYYDHQHHWFLDYFNDTHSR